jgi:hypothetical protein
MIRVLATLAVAGTVAGCLLSAPSPAPAPSLGATQEGPTPSDPPTSGDPPSSAARPTEGPTPPPSPSAAASGSLEPIDFEQPRTRHLPAGYEMPPFGARLEDLRASYRLAWLPDGYPGRRSADGSILPHPIYGVHVLADYISQYDAEPRPALRRAIDILARAAVARMESFRGSLVFRYPDGLGVSRPIAGLYSGLTQAYYAVLLYRTYQLTDEPLYRDAAELTFRSLLVPEELGGVLYRWGESGGNVAIAEIPARPRDLILNGWQTALVSIHRYAQLSGSAAARQLFEESSATLARMLPLFDAQPYRTSRYALAGPMQARLVIGPTSDGVRITALRVRIPQDGSFEVPAEQLSRWQTHLDPTDVRVDGRVLRPRGRELDLALVLSRISHPATNALLLTTEAARPLELELWLLVGRYDPLSASEVDRTWQLASRRSVPAGRHRSRLPIPWPLADLVAYPTNFLKVVEGRQTNVYHPIHVARLEKLHQLTGDPVFADYAARWRADICAWAGMALYDGLSVSSSWTPGEAVVEPERLCGPGA